jgi:phosphate:Na+ symporter
MVGTLEVNLQELIFGLIGGTALLMYGVDKMGEGLESAAGDFMRKILTVLTGNVFSAFFVGIAATVLVQSSTAITVLTVGFVNAGLMELKQAIGIILGANIGTTITAQLMAFSFHFKLTDIALPVLGFGFAISYFAKNKTVKNIGEALFGFGVMFLGLKILNGGIPFMKDNESMKFFFQTYASIPAVGVLLGMVATALVHSSSATVGLVMVLGQAGLIDLETAIYIMLGDNIGTCITAQLASATGNIHARRTAWAHTLYNVFGVLLALVIFPLFVQLVSSFTAWANPFADISASIANSHTIFNLLSAVIFLPFTGLYVKFLETFIRGKEEVVETRLNELLLSTPIAAFRATLEELILTIETTKRMFGNSVDPIITDDEVLLKTLDRDEERVNLAQREVTRYIIENAKGILSDKESPLISAFINSINNVERIGDHSVDIGKFALAKIEKKYTFSETTYEELRNLQSKVDEMFDKTIIGLKTTNVEMLEECIRLENEIDILAKNYTYNHNKRLEAGQCKIEAGVLFVDIINHIERIADHLYNINLIARDHMDILKS